MRLIDAVEEALQGIGQPANRQEITEYILKHKLWETEGKTPWETVSAQLSTDIRRYGEDSRFQRVDRGIFALREWKLEELILTPDESETDTETQQTLSFSDAAEQILLEYGEGQPMHYRQIAAIALEEELIRTKGATPEATLYSVIVQEIGRYTKRGETPRFVKHGDGMIGLSRWLPRGVAAEIKRHNQKVRSALLKLLKTMSPAEFEDLVNQLLVALGFEDVMTTAYSNDGGVDVRGTLVVGDVIRTRIAVQAKRWKKNIQAPTVQQLRGSLGTHEQGLIVTTSDFSTGARAEAERANAVPIALMNGKQLVGLLMEHEIGVIRTDYKLFELGERLGEE